MVILLVDGDAQTRAARAALLRARGYELMEAGTADEAVRWAQGAAGINLLVTEVILDNGTFGFDLSDAIRERLPQMRTLYTTRYDLTGYEHELAGAVPVPVTAGDEDFLAVVEQVLNAPPSPVPVPPEVPAPERDQPTLAPGTMLGHYQVMSCLYSEPEAETYHAIQYTVQRPVALVLLKPHLLGDEQVVKAFKERERLKASISHPRIAPLYEAGEAGGLLYYTREMPLGRSLEQIAVAGEHFSERVLVDVLYRIADAMSYAVERGCGYRPLAERDVYVDAENQASIVNVFRPASGSPRDQSADVVSLLTLVAPFANQGKARGLLQDLGDKSHDWASLYARLDDIRHDMSERSLIRRAEDEDIAVAQPVSRQWLGWTIAIMFLGLVAWLGGLTGKGLQAPKTILKQEMIEIPAGPFIYQKGPPRYPNPNLKTFWISKYKVTIAQYAEFLAALKQGSPKAFDDQYQPETKITHTPPDWAAYYAAATADGLFNNEHISLNSPVCRVDYWDAVAFAKWRHQRLPTEKEWEKAARGFKGNLYPWGNEPKPGTANPGDDYLPNGTAGKQDGYNLWAPVDRAADDISPFGVVGMAGKVQEWTSTWDIHPELPDVKVPVLRGGHFGLKSNSEILTSRDFDYMPEAATLARGFRTASDVAPETLQHK